MDGTKLTIFNMSTASTGLWHVPRVGCQIEKQTPQAFDPTETSCTALLLTHYAFLTTLETRIVITYPKNHTLGTHPSAISATSCY